MNILQIIKCFSCGTTNRTLVPIDSSAVLKCGRCQSVIIEQHLITGYVYVLKNDCMPGVFKIGMTTRSVKERIAELNGTNLPMEYECVAKAYSKNPEVDEAAIHEIFKEYRVNSQREFFKVSIDLIVEEIDKMNKRVSADDHREVHGVDEDGQGLIDP